LRWNDGAGEHRKNWLDFESDSQGRRHDLKRPR